MVPLLQSSTPRNKKIPDMLRKSLIIATTAGILTTKTNSEDSLGQEIGHQLFANPQSMATGRDASDGRRWRREAAGIIT